jgi:pimeloyl-ACP methyl ester carboxylesterase
MMLETHGYPGVYAEDYRFEVPLDHQDPKGTAIHVFARLLTATQKKDEDLPYLVYLQGGPGFESPRPTTRSGWIGWALNEFRVLLVDQRGTGLSTPVCARSLALLDGPKAQADYLTHFRADAIVQDLELIRHQLLGESTKWTILGQSFGGFCGLHYLSRAPEGLAAALFTGGLPPINGHADDVYRATYRRVIHRNEQYFERYPTDLDRIHQIVEKLRDAPVYLPGGTHLTPNVFRQLGMRLGAPDGPEHLHYLVESAFIEGPSGSEFSYRFLTQVAGHLPFDTNPIYALLHEAIYCQGAASNWSAHRMDQEFGVLNSHPFRYTGEMVYPWMFQSYSRLKPLAEAAEILAQKADWPNLYDADILAKNTVPCAAMIYDQDMYVERHLSVKTADSIGQMRTWVTNEFEHNGLRVDGPRILEYLLDLVRGVR